MNNRYLFLGLLLICITVLLPARGNKDKDAKVDRNIVQVTGVVRLVHGGLFPEVVVTASNGEWYIAREEADKLNDLQHRTVTVEGEETVTELRYAGGLPAGTRRDLKNVRIVSVQ